MSPNSQETINSVTFNCESWKISYSISVLLSTYMRHRSLGNTAYMLQTDTGTIPVYCHMTNDGIGACGGGGWTLVMKMDGHKVKWQYNYIH